MTKAKNRTTERRERKTVFGRLALAAGIVLALTARAEAVYRPVWQQDFEDAATYRNEITSSSVANAIFGTEDVLSPNLPGGTHTNEERTIYSTAETSRYFRLYCTTKNGKYNILFALPQLAVSATDYKIEFDYYLSHVTHGDFSGLAINGAKGPLATIYGEAGNKNTESSGKLYRSDSTNEVLATVKSWGRGNETTPSANAAQKYWMHFTVTGTQQDGVNLSVVRADGVQVYEGVVADEFDVVESLYLTIDRNNETYPAYACLDNVVVSLPGEAAECVWTGAGGDGKWGNGANWSLNGERMLAPPLEVDAAVFQAKGAGVAWEVDVDANPAIAKVRIDGAARFSGGRITCSDFGGGGVLSLAGATLYRNDADLVISNDLEIVAGTTNAIRLASDKNNVYNCHLYGDMTGAGYLDVAMHANGGADKGMKFHGDNRAFAGTFNSTTYYARNGTSFDTAACASAGAVWRFDNNSPKDNTQTALFTSTADTYRFGAFVGRMKSAYGRRKVEFGGRSDVETDATLSNRHDSDGVRNGGFDVVKVGDGFARLASATENGSIGTDAIESLEIRGGTVALANAVPMTSLSFSGEGATLQTPFDPSGVIMNSTSDIVFDDLGTNQTWLSIIDDTNGGGLVKRGGGTLTLAQPPDFKGYTTVEDGCLVVSNMARCALGERTRSTVDEYGTVTIEPSEKNAVAMAGLVSYENFADALAAWRVDRSIVLTLLADVAEPIEIALGESITLVDLGHAFEILAGEQCRIDVDYDMASGTGRYSHVLDIVSVAAPSIANATYSATTNGVELALRDDGTFGVLRGEEVVFAFTAAEDYLLGAATVALVASADDNEIAAADLPFAIRVVDALRWAGEDGGNWIGGEWRNADGGEERWTDGKVARLVEIAEAQTVSLSASGIIEAAALSLEAAATRYRLVLDGTVVLRRLVFVPGATLEIVPPVDVKDGDALIRWDSPLDVSRFALVGAAEDSDWVLRSEPDGLKIYKATHVVVSGAGQAYSSVEAAFAAAGDGDTVQLASDSWLFERVDIPDGASLTLDLCGRTLKAKSRWAFNVGSGSLTVANGAVNCTDYGFYVTEGTLAFANCSVAAARRVAQVRGAGRVAVAADARLETMGEDPVIFAVGGFNGRARVESRGTLVQSFADGDETTAYDVAGNPRDTFGADFFFSGGKGVSFASAADACVHHPDGQGGGVAISGGWFSVAPQQEWLEQGFGILPEVLETWDGWRVLFKGFFLRIR